MFPRRIPLPLKHNTMSRKIGEPEMRLVFNAEFIILTAAVVGVEQNPGTRAI